MYSIPFVRAVTPSLRKIVSNLNKNQMVMEMCLSSNGEFDATP